MNRPSTIAAIATVLAAVLLALLLLLCKLTFDPDTMLKSEPPVTELLEVEEFAELFEPAVVPANPSKAYNEVPARRQSTPAEAAGSDIADAGDAAAPTPDVTSERPSPVVREQKETPEKTGADKKASEEEEARRQARAGVSNAFKKNDEPADNTASKGSEKGNSGSPQGAASDLNGTGSGTVGGGWIMPRYAKVKSAVTGSIKLQAVVDREGNVKSVELVGGKAPASSDHALVERCMAEVRSHRFTRNDNNAPERATATITYTFL